MLYKKPDDMKYTDMAIYIDSKIGKDKPSNEEIELIYEYLYHLSFMLAHKNKYFNKADYYDDFAIYCAGVLINRLFYNPKLNAVDDAGKPLLNPIKSILNYLKASIYGMKVSFEQETYCQKFTKNVANDITSDFHFNKKIYESLDSRLESDISIYLSSVARVVKHFVYRKNHYRNNPVMMKNIYLSCLLSILNSITFTDDMVEKIRTTYSLPDSKNRYLERMYKQNKENCIILYHLSEDLRAYITVLVRQLLDVINQDLHELSVCDIAMSDNLLEDIVYLELDGKVSFD